jgi:ribose transport system substrate-binding protein
MKFKINWLAALGLGAALLAGCSSPAPQAKEDEGAKPTASGEKIKIGVSIPAADHGWTAGVVWWAEKAMKEHPDIEWVFKTAADPQAQISDLETMAAQGVKGLVILATESAPLTPVAKELHDKGIYLVNVDRGFLEPVADVFLEGDNVAFGRKSAEFVVEKLGGKGNLIILEGIPSTVNSARVNAAKEVFAKYPGIKILDSQSGMWNREKALNVMQTLLVKHKQVDAVWAQDDDMALGVEQAIKEANRTDIEFILGGAGMKDIVKRVMDGDPMFPADITYPPSMIKDGIDRIVADLKAGKKRKEPFQQEKVVIDVTLITPENAKDHYFPDSVY